jgi:hypothetical protein
MRKSLIVGTCLANAGKTETPAEGERLVEQVFRAQFPDENYGVWNRDVDDLAANGIIQRVGGSARIQTEQLIRDVWELR